MNPQNPKSPLIADLSRGASRPAHGGPAQSHVQQGEGTVAREGGCYHELSSYRQFYGSMVYGSIAGWFSVSAGYTDFFSQCLIFAISYLEPSMVLNKSIIQGMLGCRPNYASSRGSTVGPEYGSPINR